MPLATEAFRAGGEAVITEPEGLGEGVLALPSVVSAAGAMVVLGEPGAGKTSVLADLTDALSWTRGEGTATHACGSRART
jgi:hypothetical protein